MRKIIACAAFALVATSISQPAFAGEVTGGPRKTTPVGEVAQSICAFSGLEDGITLIGFDEFGIPIFINVDFGPGLVQNPHQENAAGIIHAPGIPGTACRGN